MAKHYGIKELESTATWIDRVIVDAGRLDAKWGEGGWESVTEFYKWPDRKVERVRTAVAALEDAMAEFVELIHN